jgi:hypothetical protein
VHRWSEAEADGTQVEMARGLLESGKPPRDVAKAFGVGRSTLYRVLKLMDDSVMVASGAE